MNSSWRHVADPEVGFAWSVTPWLVGNLVDIPFDGQVSIKRRDNPRPAEVSAFVGNRALLEDVDPEYAAPFAGPKDEFVVTGPWVLQPDPSAPLAADRDRLSERARAMLAGSGSEHENDYLETAVWADLVPPAAQPVPSPPAPDDAAQATPRADGPGHHAAPATPETPTDRRPLPATGGSGLALLGLVLALAACLLRRGGDVAAPPGR
jgi:hypothetical protein